MAAVHARLEPLLCGRPAEAGWPARETLAADLQSRLPRWAGVAGRTHSADCGPLLAQAIAALTAHLAHAGAGGEGDEVLCHGDWSPDHFAIASGRLTGALDWEHVRVAPAAYDLATAVVGLFAHGLSARASRAIGDALAAAYASSGRAVPGLPFLSALLAVERLVQALDLRSQALGGGDAPAWAGLAGLCLARL
jgi:aminoglycoside phosphotransferase (APT) family kinase protein